MSEIKTSPFSFSDFYIKESHLKLNSRENLDLKVSLKPRGKFLKSSSEFFLDLQLNIVDEEKEFAIEVLGVATFKFKNEEGSEQIGSVK